MGVLSAIIADIRAYLEERRKRRAAELERRQIEKERRLEQERKEYERKQMLYRIGNDFEDYVLGMFDPVKFQLIHRTPTNDDTNGKFVHSMIYPDLRFREIATGRTFWIEVKYRARTEEKGAITWCTENQLRNYKRTMYETRDPVFVIIGIGGSTQAPNRTYCINLDRINFTTLYYGTYAHNRVYGGKVDSLDRLYSISQLNKNDRSPDMSDVIY